MAGATPFSLASSQSSFRCNAASFLSARPRPLLRLQSVRATPVVAEADAPEKRKPTKASDFRSLTAEQVTEEVQKAKRALFDLRMAQRTKQPFKPSDFGYHQTKIAQLLTISREREIEQGINLRQARKTEKNKLVAAGFGGLYR